MSRNTGGRPSKLTDELQAHLALLVKAGCSLEVAAEASGVSRSTVNGWIKRGERSGQANEPYRVFAAAVEEARAKAEASLVAQMRRAAANGSWRASAWLLERTAPERWARVKTTPADPVADPVADPFLELDELAQRRSRG